MSDGIRDELRELLFDTAPPPAVDGAAMFERTFAADGPDGADLLPPDDLFDLPLDDPTDDQPPDGLDLPADPDPDLAGDLDGGADGGVDLHGGDLHGGDPHLGDPGLDPAPWDLDAEPGSLPDAPFDDGSGAGW